MFSNSVLGATVICWHNAIQDVYGEEISNYLKENSVSIQ